MNNSGENAGNVDEGGTMVSSGGRNSPRCLPILILILIIAIHSDQRNYTGSEVQSEWLWRCWGEKGGTDGVWGAVPW